jgi:hypothetical protein
MATCPRRRKASPACLYRRHNFSAAVCARSVLEGATTHPHHVHSASCLPIPLCLLLPPLHDIASLFICRRWRRCLDPAAACAAPGCYAPSSACSSYLRVFSL